MSVGPEPKARIAICEDERIVALDIRAFLQRNDYEVPGIYAAAEDLLASAEATRPDLVLMDIHLQGEMDGVEAAAVLFERWAIPVILLTAYADGPTIERAKLTHPYAYILKPYDERELKTAISIGLYRASMERKLRRNEVRYRSLFENGLAATMLVERGGTILESNRAYSKFSAGASSVQEFLSDESERALLLKSMEDGNAYGPSEVKVTSADGREAWALLSAAAIELPDGTRAYQCQAVDITERKTLMDQLVHAQKLSALGRFAGGVAHDFNNVLTAVMGYSRLLRSDFENEGRGLEELDGIDHAAKRAAALSRQLLMFSRRDETKPSVFSLSELAGDNERMMRRIVGEGATLVIRSGDGSDTVLADRARLEQAVVNLVANARDAMPEGGRIVVATGVERIDEARRGALDEIPAGEWSFIEVSDEGTGISPEDQASIFQPFFTTKPPDRGTGLGLSTVVGIVSQAKGRVDLSSSVGVGTTMRLLFPRAEVPRQGGPEEERETAEREAAKSWRDSRYGAANGRVVLLVENDDSVRAIIEALLDRVGYRVLSARQPGEALLLSENPSHAPDILVADNAMTLMNGPVLASRLRITYKDLPALYLRNIEYASEDEERASADGDVAADPRGPKEAFLSKPFREEALLSALASLLDGSG
ncbi:MAG: response regulator [Spirochaetes bacterium]|nr:response regulator [Spirochaetota bacterium]MBU1080746.1 response regulator [Spirochaetota bacterium]